MTDNEILKALECCKDTVGANCGKCPYDECCSGSESIMLKDALDLINRQKAEIERLEKIRQVQGKRIADLRGVKYEQIEVIHNLKQELITAKAEAYKEAWKKAKKEVLIHGCVDVDDFFKELVGEQVE